MHVCLVSVVPRRPGQAEVESLDGITELAHPSHSWLLVLANLAYEDNPLVHRSIRRPELFFELAAALPDVRFVAFGGSRDAAWEARLPPTGALSSARSIRTASPPASAITRRRTTS